VCGWMRRGRHGGGLVFSGWGRYFRLALPSGSLAKQTFLTHHKGFRMKLDRYGAWAIQARNTPGNGITSAFNALGPHRAREKPRFCRMEKTQHNGLTVEGRFGARNSVWSCSPGNTVHEQLWEFCGASGELAVSTAWERRVIVAADEIDSARPGNARLAAHAGHMARSAHAHIGPTL